MLYIEPTFFLFSALLCLTVPVSWLFSALFAAIVHEFCHIASIFLFGGQIQKIRITVWGAMIEADLCGVIPSVLAALAGPVGSLMLIAIWQWMPQIALCGCIQGLYNLIPTKHSDGSNALRIILSIKCPESAKYVVAFAETISSLLLFFVLLYLIKACF